MNVYNLSFFSMYINDIADEFYLHGINGIEIDTLKVFLLLDADDITIFAETAEGLQEGLNLLSNYCTRWKLILNTDKTKVMVFRKGGILPRFFFFFFFFFFFLIQFNVPFQDYFSSYETGQSVDGAKTGEPREKPPGTPASKTWLVSHVARAGLEPTPDTAVR